MDGGDPFGRQLADLRRAASRAGRGSDDDAGRGEARAAASRGAGRGSGVFGGAGNDDPHYRRRDRDDYRGRDDRRKRGRDDDDGRTDDRRYDSERFRGRGGRHRGRGYGRGRFGGGGGRRNYDYDNGGSDHRRGGWNDGRDRRDGRNEWNRDGRNGGSDEGPPLSELVEKAAERHGASKSEEANSATNTGGAAGDATTTTKKKRRHVALLFLTISDLPHERVWREWMKSAADDRATVEEDVDVEMNRDGPTPSENSDATAKTSNRDDSASDVLVSVICHAKYPERIRSEWLRRRHLLRKSYAANVNSGDDRDADGAKFHSRRPEWGSIEITRAMIDLLEEGLRIGAEGRESRRRYLSTSEKDATNDTDLKPAASSGTKDADIPPVDRFVFASESCLPVATLKETELALFGPRSAASTKDVSSLYDKSWVNARSAPNNGYARQLQWDAIRGTDIPSEFVWKADQWMALNRAHAEAVASLPGRHLGGRSLWTAFRNVRASDEMYFPTALSILGVLRRPEGSRGEVDENSRGESCAGDEVRRRKITYCDWSVGAKNPASFTRKDWKEVVEKARGEGCLLARKFVARKSPMTAAGRGGRRDAGTGVGAPRPAAADGDDNGPVSVEDWRSAVAERGA